MSFHKQHIEDSFQRYFLQNALMPKKFILMNFSPSELKLYSKDRNHEAINSYINRLKIIPKNKSVVYVMNEYSGLNKGFIADKSIIFTSNKKSDNIGAEIIYIPLLNRVDFCIKAKPISKRKYLYSFVGQICNQIRKDILEIKYDKSFVSTNEMDSLSFNKLLANSIFSLAPRGINASSYRICEALRNESIPVYVSDEFILPENFEEYGIIIKKEDISRIPEILMSYSDADLDLFMQKGREYYNKMFTYEGLSNWIIDKLNNM